MYKKLKVLDLFCGAGGLSLGFSMAGFDVVAGIDNDKEALETYGKNFPKAKAIYEDLSCLSDSTIASIDKVDVMLGGPPCQGFSIAGKRDEKDPRNQLTQSYLKLVALVNPKAVVIENVPNILSMGNGAFARRIVDGLSRLGYLVSVEKLNAADFGVPQNRRRVFFIAIKNHDIKLLDFELSKVSRPVTTKEAIDDLPLLDDELGSPIMTYSAEATSEFQKKMRSGSQVLTNHEAVAHKQRTKEIIALVPDGGNYKDLPIELQGTRKVNIAWTRMNSERPCFTIDAGHNHHFHYKANRVPTVRECARIQSFPDTFSFEGKRTSQYRQVGNAVPPMLAKVIACKIKGIIEVKNGV